MQGVFVAGVMQRCLAGLRLYSKKKEKNRREKGLAEKGLGERLKLKAIRILSAYSKVKLMRREVGAQIGLGSDMLRLKKAMKAFKSLLEYNRQLKENFTRVGLKKLVSTMRQVLKMWARKYKRHRRARKKLAIAQNSLLKTKSFTAWKAAARQKKGFIKRLGTLLTHKATLLLSKAIAGFRRRRQCKEVAKMNKAITQMHSASVILRKAVASLKYCYTIDKLKNFLLHNKRRRIKKRMLGMWMRAFSEIYKAKGFSVDRTERMKGYYMKKWSVIAGRKQALRRVVKGYTKFAKIKYWMKWKRSLKLF
eukprot:TRINITY_DN3626_c0_g7_i1.p1 TRINITY_DN3626_c0_g7~~TRINITY_DN3626_c0_g7_i1.p1  ORF type:complete len:307 (+),score=68.79 TRINITY_DN3626_c0_g7_i1:159-1079(+)